MSDSISKLYAVRDLKADFFLSPFIAHNDHHAKRAFAEAASDPATGLYQFPTDYELYYVGDFDVVAGTVISADKISLGCASSYRRTTLNPPAAVETTFGDSDEVNN